MRSHGCLPSRRCRERGARSIEPFNFDPKTSVFTLPIRLSPPPGSEELGQEAVAEIGPAFAESVPTVAESVPDSWPLGRTESPSEDRRSYSRGRVCPRLVAARPQRITAWGQAELQLLPSLSPTQLAAFPPRSGPAFSLDDHIGPRGQPTEFADRFGLVHRACVDPRDQLGSLLATRAQSADFSDTFNSCGHASIPWIEFEGVKSRENVSHCSQKRNRVSRLGKLETVQLNCRKPSDALDL